MSETHDVNYLNGLFGKTEAAPESTGYKLPDGDYHCKLDRIALDVAKSSGKLNLATEYEILDGDLAGRKIYRWNSIPEATTTREDAARAIAFLKRDLLTLGAPVESPAFQFGTFMNNDLGSLLDTEVTVTVWTNKKDPTQSNTKITAIDAAVGGAAKAGKAPAGKQPAAAAGTAAAPVAGGEYDPFAEE